jgi:diguanylate cyclase (GGDEF)-like protein
MEQAPWFAWGRSPQAPLRGVGATVEAVIARWPLVGLWAFAAALLAGFGILDYVTGSELAFSIFYLVPVLFVTWFISRRGGLLMSVAGAAVWALADNLGGMHYSSDFVPVWNSLVRLGFFVIVTVLIDVMKESRKREALLANTDSLTGIANGRSFASRANLELAFARRTNSPLTMAYIDLDHFKEVNDTVGHSEGDRLLREVAHAIESRLRETDLVARLGGDEFGVLLANTSADSAPAVLRSLVEACSGALAISLGVGCTVGGVTFERAPESVDFMVRTADEEMYRGKRAGRGRIQHSIWPPPIVVSEATDEASGD